MKQLMRISALLLLVFALALSLVACGDDPCVTHVDGNGDSKCDNCGVTVEPGNGNGGDGDGDNCTEHVDGDGDGECDNCGETVDNGGDGDGDNLAPLPLDDASFDDRIVTYNGQPQVNENFRCSYKRYDKKFEYYDQNGNLLSTNTGVVEPGVYTVRVIVSVSGYADNYLEATLTIVEPNTITYTCETLNGVEFPASNPSLYSSADANMALADPSFEGYKFKGWYLNGERIEQILTKEFEGDLVIVAVFQPYLAYPEVYVPGTTEESLRPEQLPELPFIDQLDEDAFLLVDMSKLWSQLDADKNPDETEKDINLNFYNNLKLSEYTPLYTTLTTEGGQTVFEWIDFNDAWDLAKLQEVYGDTVDLSRQNNWAAYDAMFNNRVSFNLNPGDYSKYDTVEFWAYSAAATGRKMGFTFWTDNVDTRTARQEITLDWVGWKKFTFSYDDFNKVGGNMNNLSSLSILASGAVYGSTEAGSLTMQYSADNYFFLSNVYLTNNKSGYNGRMSIAQAEMVRVMENFSSLTYMPMEGLDAMVDTLIDTFDNEGTTLWGQDPTTADGINNIYMNIYMMAMAWNSPELDGYYQDETILETIADALNYMYDNDYFGASVAEAAYLGNVSFDAFAPVCTYLPIIVLTVGDHVEFTHSESWMLPVIALVPGGMGTGHAQANTASIAACAYLAMGDQQNFLANLRQVIHCYTSGSIDGADTVSIMLMRALIGTEFQPSISCANRIFDWYLSNVDGLTFKGTRIADSAYFDMSVLLFPAIKDMFNEEQQALLAQINAIYKKNGQISSSVVSSCPYAEVVEYYNSLDTNPEARESENLCYFAEGVAIFKNEDYYLYINDRNQVYSVNCDEVNELNLGDLFDGMAQNGVLAVAGDGVSVIATADGVTVANGPLCIYDDDLTYSAYVATSDNANANDTDLYGASAPCIVLSEYADGAETFTVHYNGEAGSTLTLYIMEGGSYTLPADTETLSFASAGGIITVEITFPFGSDDVTFTMTRG